jgi:peroxiredoxin family protein
MASETKYLFDPEITPPNLAGNSKKLDKKALNTVIERYKAYDNMRNITQGGKTFRLEDRLDELYRLYMMIRSDNDHNYIGEAEVFMPIARKAVNIIESESSNALFSRDDFFSMLGEGGVKEKQELANVAFEIMKHYSDKCKHVPAFELILKQCLVYGITVSEACYKIEKRSYLTRENELEDVVDPATQEPMVDQQGNKAQRKLKKAYKVEVAEHKPMVKARDVYRVYCNILSPNPELYDVVYRDTFTPNELLENAENGVYDSQAVDRLLKKRPSMSHNMERESGNGKTYIATISETDDVHGYEVLRFQGLFTIKDDSKKIILKKPFWIDIGERTEVLRLQECPLVGQDKTFSFTNYDTMLDEFTTDGVIDPIKSINYEINDKENQSLDAVSFDLNAPYEVVKSSGLEDSDIEEISNTPHKALWVKERNSIAKLVSPIDTAHLNTDLSRLNTFAEGVTGSTSLAAGSPTGTQADRSGKALGILQAQTKSQFSKFIRKFERDMIEATMQKLWDMIMQFNDEEVTVKIMGPNNTAKVFDQKVDDIVGRYVIKVSGGSQYIKEKELRESIMEFLSVASMNDTFFKLLDPILALTDIAKASPYDMSKYVKPDNMISTLKGQIDQLIQAAQQGQQQMGGYEKEIQRLGNELKQTDRANMVNPPAIPQKPTNAK